MLWLPRLRCRKCGAFLLRRGFKTRFNFFHEGITFRNSTALRDLEPRLRQTANITNITFNLNILNIGNELVKTVQNNSYGWIGRKTTIFGWNNTGSKRLVKIKFGLVLQIAVWRKRVSKSLDLFNTGDTPSFDILCCFFFTVLIGNAWIKS